MDKPSPTSKRVLLVEELAPAALRDAALRAEALAADPSATGGAYRCTIEGGQAVEVLWLGAQVTLVQSSRRQTYRHRPGLHVGDHVGAWLSMSPEAFAALHVQPEPS